MRKLSLSITILLLSVLSSYGQTSQSEISLPSVASVSPEAASLGKYGDLPVNLSTGRINYSIPIFTIKENGIELPIYLSYNNSGLLAEEDPGLVGLGWTLHAGGMIIRQLRGKPDEKPLGYLKSNIGKDWVIPYNFNLWNNLSVNAKKAKVFNLLNGASSGRLDTQPDKFVINAGKLSGNFSYNELGSPVFFPQKNYKLTKNNGYTVTDDNGIKYEFTAKEHTTTESPPTSAMTYVSGWYLTKIISPISYKTIDFNYTQGANYYKESYSESRKVNLNSTGNIQKCNINTANQKSLTITQVTSKQQIRRINFAHGSILFDIRDVPLHSKSTSKNYLHAITIKDQNGKTINRYQFVFDNLMSNFKLLKEIKKFGDNGSQIPFYKLEYNGTPPTSIFYAKQDSWGYYNGSNNTNLISGNRNVNFATASLGALTKIIYPTKGFTKITYEANKVPLLENSFLNSGQCFKTPINKVAMIAATSSQTPSPTSKSITIKTAQTIRVKLEASTGGRGIAEAFANIVSSGRFHCDIFNPCNAGSCITSVSSIIELGQHLDPVDNKTAYFEVDAGTVLTLSARASGTNASGAASITVDYYDPDLFNSTNNYIKIGGIRVASTKDCVVDGDCISKQYKYIKKNGTSSGKVLSNPIYSYIYKIMENTGVCYIQQFSANSKVPLASFQGAPVLYERVETLFNGNQNNGKKVQYFTYEFDAYPGFPFIPANPKSWRKGNLLKEEIYQNKEGVLKLVKKTENTYQAHYPFPTGATAKKHSIGTVAGRKTYQYNQFNDSSLVEGDPNHYAENSYNNRPEFYHLIQTKTTDYYNDEKIISTTNYTYNTPTGFLKEQTTTNSKGKVLKVIHSYPTSGTLVTQNRIAAPIETETLNGSTQLSKQKTVYAGFGSLYLPQKVQTSKAAKTLEDRVVYHSYDTKGNPTEVSKKDGTSVVYIWGYHQTKPIAKIEGIKLSVIPTATITNIQNLSNADNDRTLNASGKEGALRTALNNLRNLAVLKDAQVTTFTYDPLIGVTSITDPRGETIYYDYDNLNRLKTIKNSDGHIVTEHQYNYKN